MPLFRIEPAMPAQAYKTYGVSMPIASHWEPATCEDVDCEAFLSGWVTTVDLSTELGQRQYEYVTHDKSRSFSEQRVTATLVKLLYKPGNKCFRASDHKLPAGRPARFYVRDGDYRGNPLGTPVRVHKNAEDWTEDFSEHQDKLHDALERG